MADKLDEFTLRHYVWETISPDPVFIVYYFSSAQMWPRLITVRLSDKSVVFICLLVNKVHQ